VNLLAAVGVIDEQNLLEGGADNGPATRPATGTSTTPAVSAAKGQPQMMARAMRSRNNPPRLRERPRDIGF